MHTFLYCSYQLEADFSQQRGNRLLSTNKQNRTPPHPHPHPSCSCARSIMEKACLNHLCCNRFTQNTPVLQACMCSDPSGDNNLTVNPATPHLSSKHLRIRQTTHSSSNTGAKIHPSTTSSQHLYPPTYVTIWSLKRVLSCNTGSHLGQKSASKTKGYSRTLCSQSKPLVFGPH